MTLTVFNYMVVVALEKHFGRGSEACHVLKSTLSVANKKPEEKLLVKLFECIASAYNGDAAGEEIVTQTQRAPGESLKEDLQGLISCSRRQLHFGWD